MVRPRLCPSGWPWHQRAVSTPLDADVVIAGGGLAGAATAIALARLGLSAVVVDKADFPRDKPCGEGLLPHGLSLLAELGIGDVVDECDGQPFRGILYRCHGVVARGDFAGGESGRGLRRRMLDAAVRKRAEALGVQLVAGTVAAVAVADEGGNITLSTGQVLRGRVVVGADGPRSVVRHGLGLDLGPPSQPRFALRQHFRLRPGTALPDRVEVHVGDHHEMYVTPVGGGGSNAGHVVGVAALCEKKIMAAGDGPPAERLASLIARCPPLAERLDGAVADGPAQACGPLRVRSKAVWKGRAVLVGDAAGYIDAITGEGMSLALRTALSAAKAIRAVVDGAGLHVHADARFVDRCFAGYRDARMATFRDHAILTVGLVELARHPFFARRAIARLAKDPALFTRLLAVNNGTASLLSLGIVDALKLGIGSSPAAHVDA